MQTLLLELNEINFDYVKVYAARGDVPHLGRLIDEHGLAETTSEREYENLEPWIQWVTAHTGLSYSEHKIFRLGDISHQNFVQIWEQLERQGLRVGAISPMNAANRTQNAAFFVPDPWTDTKLSAPPLLYRLFSAVRQVVNDNAHARIAPASAVWLLVGLARYACPINYGHYASLIAGARTHSWRKAMLLDLLLTDVFIRETQRKKPQFASLFVNAGAHIQHHYLFNSAAYEGSQKNPEWYVASQEDPVREVYRLYDRLVGQIIDAFPEARLIVATGLHQDPHPEVTYYWRIKQHSAFLSKIGVPFIGIEPRMSRDFLIRCASETDAIRAEQLLVSARSENGLALFDVDNRGRDLFVMLTWSDDISPDFIYFVGNDRFQGLRDDVAFVAIKNGRHNGVGYFLDTGATPQDTPRQFPLKDLPSRICTAVGVDWMVDSCVDNKPTPLGFESLKASERPRGGEHTRAP